MSCVFSVISEDDEEEIRSLMLRRRQVELLLDKISHSKPGALEVLIEALSKENQWLSELLDDDLKKKQKNTPIIDT